MTKKEAEAQFRELITPALRSDRPALRQAWNEFVDRLARDGQISEKQAAAWEQPKWVSRR